MEENENYDIPEWQRCQKCHIRPIDKTENYNSVLCAQCREEQIRYPFPKKMIPVILLVLAVMAAALARTPKTLNYYRVYQKAKEQAATGQIYEALTGMQEIVEAYPDSLPVAKRAVELSMESGYYDFGAYIIDGYIAGKKLDNSTYTTMNMYVNKLTRYYNTLDLIQGLAEGMDETDSPEEVRKKLETELQKALRDREQYPALIYYYLGNMAEDSGKALEYMEKSVEADGKLNMSQVSLGTIKRRMGDLEGAREAYEAVYARDKSDPDMLRALGILCMLEGDREQGLSLAENAYELNPEGAYIKETYIIALMENGRTEEAKTLKAQFDSEGEVFDEEFNAYLDGGVSLRDYYITE